MKTQFNKLLLIFIFISSLCFPQKKFLFDAAHAETASNADWIIDGDNGTPARYPTPPQSGITSSTPETYWTGALSSWGIALVKLGNSVETLPIGSSITYGTANAQDLKNYDVFVIDEPNTKFTTAEKTALIQFVQNGGGLFMISDHTVSDRNGDGWDSPMIWNDLFTANGIVTNPFGMAVDLTNISQTSTNVAAGDYLITGSAGTVTAMKWSNGATTTLNPTANSSVTGVVWTSGTAHGNTNLMVSRAKYGTGRVVLVCDSSPADDGTGTSGDQLYVGWLDPDVNGSHAALHLNGSLWLAKILEPVSGSLLTVTPTSLSGFTYYFGAGPSTSQSFSLSGSGLTGFPGNITVTAPANFEVSLDNSSFAASKLVSFSSATLSSTTVYVRLKSGLAVTTYSGDVTNAGGGATTTNVTCSGVVNYVPSPTLSVSVAALSGFSYTVGAGPSANQSYTVSGTNLSPSSGSITVQCLTDYEVSTNGSTFTSSVSPSYTGGTLSATTIYVRLKAGLSVASYNSETVSNAGGSATTQNVTCSGVVNAVSTVLFTDDMNYTAGTLLSANGWTAHSGAGTNSPAITTPGLSYSNYAGSGVGNAVTLTGNGEDDNHSFTSVTTGAIYASAMINVTSANSTGDYFFHFGSGTATTYNARVYVKSATGGFVFGVCKSSTSANIQWSSTVLATGTTHFIVLKYTFVAGSTNDKAELFINPAVGGSEPASDLSALITDADFTSIDRLCFRQGSTTPVVIIDGIRIDQSWAGVTPATATSKTLNLTALLEGPFNGSVMENDVYPLTVTVELHDAGTYALVESKTGELSPTGSGIFTYSTAANGTPYYITVKASNTLETQSAAPQSFTSGTLSYDFTTGIGQAYTDGGNIPPMIQKGSKWCLFSGDVNQDAGIDLTDLIATSNDNLNGTPGFYSSLPTDVNGDGGVDLSDLIIVSNNNVRGVYDQLLFAPSSKFIKLQVKSQDKNSK